MYVILCANPRRNHTVEVYKLINHVRFIYANGKTEINPSDWYLSFIVYRQFDSTLLLLQTKSNFTKFHYTRGGSWCLQRSWCICFHVPLNSSRFSEKAAWRATPIMEEVILVEDVIRTDFTFDVTFRGKYTPSSLCWKFLPNRWKTDKAEIWTPRIRSKWFAKCWCGQKSH